MYIWCEKQRLKTHLLNVRWLLLNLIEQCQQLVKNGINACYLDFQKIVVISITTIVDLHGVIYKNFNIIYAHPELLLSSRSWSLVRQITDIFCVAAIDDSTHGARMANCQMLVFIYIN